VTLDIENRYGIELSPWVFNAPNIRDLAGNVVPALAHKNP